MEEKKKPSDIIREQSKEPLEFGKIIAMSKLRKKAGHCEGY